MNNGTCGFPLVHVLSYDKMLSHLRKGFRNAKWHRLSRDDKAMYRACLEFARVNGKVRNPIVVTRILGIIEKLENAIKTALLRVGMDKAKEMLVQYAERDVFDWLPQLKVWLQNPSYLMWLGTLRMNDSVLFR